jgi:hypothetical protein
MFSTIEISKPKKRSGNTSMAQWVVVKKALALQVHEHEVTTRQLRRNIPKKSIQKIIM